jgi:hypothetical protein
MDYKIFLQSLSWDEFQTYKTKVNQVNLTDEQKEILRVEDSRRAIEYTRFMSF